MEASIARKKISEHVWQLTDIYDARAYLVLGAERALLVDTMAGFGDLPATLRSITHLPVTVALTHRHYDHVAGSYGFPEVWMSAADDGHWDVQIDNEKTIHAQVCKEKDLSPDLAWPLRDGSIPHVRHVCEGDRIDLGGVNVTAYELPGHTPGSVGYLVQEDRALLSGDAVTPIMCLFFPESLPITTYRQSLRRMNGLPFDEFWTGHHDIGFSHDSLKGFDDAAAYAEAASKGIQWMHARLQQFTGTLYVKDSRALLDADSPDFRAVIAK